MRARLPRTGTGVAKSPAAIRRCRSSAELIDRTQPGAHDRRHDCRCDQRRGNSEQEGRYERLIERRGELRFGCFSGATLATTVPVSARRCSYTVLVTTVPTTNIATAPAATTTTYDRNSRVRVDEGATPGSPRGSHDLYRLLRTVPMQLWSCSIADGLANVADVDVDQALVAVEVPPPYPLDQLATGEHPPRRLSERGEELELVVLVSSITSSSTRTSWRGTSMMRPSSRVTSSAVSMAAASPWRGGGARRARRRPVRCGLRTAWRCSRPRPVRVDQLVGLVRGCGEHDHVDRRGAPDLAEHVEAADTPAIAGRARPGREHAERSERLVAVDRLVDLDLAAEIRADQITDGCLVIDHQDSLVSHGVHRTRHVIAKSARGQVPSARRSASRSPLGFARHNCVERCRVEPGGPYVVPNSSCEAKA